MPQVERERFLLQVIDALSDVRIVISAVLGLDLAIQGGSLRFFLDVGDEVDVLCRPRNAVDRAGNGCPSCPPSRTP